MQRSLLLSGGALAAILAVLAAPVLAGGPTGQEMFTASASATSWLQSSWSRFEENYHPNYAFDGDPATGWVEGSSGDGAGDAIQWPISAIRSARSLSLEIRSGYHKSEGLFTANAAPRQVRVTVLDARGGAVATLDAELARTMAPQTLTVPLVADRSFSGVRLEIRSAWPGTKYKDTVISEIRTFVDAIPVSGAVAYDAAFEQSKRAALLAWKKERVERAAWFASVPATYPWSGTRADRLEATPMEAAAMDAALAPFRTLDAELSKGATRWLITQKNRSPVPDGIYDDTGNTQFALSLLRAADFGFFEAQGSTAYKKVEGEEGMYQSVERSSAQVVWEGAPGGAPKAAAWSVRWRSDGRELSMLDGRTVVTWDAEGRLSAVYQNNRNSGESSCRINLERLLSPRWEDGKVSGLMELRYERSMPSGELDCTQYAERSVARIALLP